MKLPELLAAHPPSVDLASYRRTPRGMPPLTASELSMAVLLGGAQMIEGNAALQLRYKGCAAASTSLNEQENGERWNVVQLQGSSSRKAYRVATCFAVANCFADQLRAYMLHPDAEVRQVTMPHGHGITNLDGARDYEGAIRKYDVYASLLGMRYSEEMHMYVMDVRDDMRRLLIGEAS
ncbi:MAG TPA: hypothetical protein PKV72_04775 [Candidatus Peribacteria bacterium]|nr:hypothetical protein [Candidatus Peribacteria bacterium]